MKHKEFWKDLLINFIVVFTASYLAISIVMDTRVPKPPKMPPPPSLGEMPNAMPKPMETSSVNSTMPSPENFGPPERPQPYPKDKSPNQSQGPQ